MLTSAVILDVVQLKERLYDRVTMQCMGCGYTKPANPTWGVCTFASSHPLAQPITYAVCPACSTEAGKERAFFTAKTMSREQVENKGML